MVWNVDIFLNNCYYDRYYVLFICINEINDKLFILYNIFILRYRLVVEYLFELFIFFY